MGGSGVSPAAEWNKLGQLFYRKRELYQMAWREANLDCSLVAVARYGGPVATVHDDRKLSKLGRGIQTSKPTVRIFSASGRLLSSFSWEDESKIHALGWAENEILLCVGEGGAVLPYNVQGELQPNQFSFGSDVQRNKVKMCHIWETGLVVVSSDDELFTVTNLQEPRVQRLASPSLSPEDRLHCMAVVEPQFTFSGTVEVLLAVNDTIMIVDSESVQDQGLKQGPMLRMSVAPNGQLLACFTHDGRLLVMSTNFSKILPEFGTRSTIPPEQLVWCGTDSVMLYWEEILLMVGPYGDWVKYSYEEPAVLMPETDGVRVLTQTRHEFLQRVPDSLVNIFSIGSTSASALLYDALELFDSQSARAHENLRTIGPKLAEAAHELVEAAANEYDIAQQRMLLRGAAYGRTFLQSSQYRPSHLMDTCQTLRLLNAVRAADIGIPISFLQYQQMTAPALIQRLLSTHRHLLALRISDMLNLGPERVLLHWASAKMAASTKVPDKDLLNLLLEKLKGCPGISFAQIAANAHRRGRPRLAALLLDHEPRAAEQVPLLTSMGEDERALIKAIESGDTDLVYLAVFHLWRKCQFGEFVKLINDHPQARRLFLAYCRRTDPELLKSYHFSVGATLAAAEAIFSEAKRYNYKKMAEGVAVTAADVTFQARQLDQARDLYAKSKEHGFHKQALDEFSRLLKLQVELELNSKTRFVCVGKSINETVRRCILANNLSAAKKIKDEFKVSDKHFWWLRLRSLVDKKDWMGLESLAKEKKSPIGYEPFVRQCIDFQAPQRETSKYIARVMDLELRAQLYTEVGMLREAAETQTQAQSSQGMSKIQNMFGNFTMGGTSG